MAKPKENPNYKVIADNRRARFDYAIEDDIEVGIPIGGFELADRLSLDRGGESELDRASALGGNPQIAVARDDLELLLDDVEELEFDTDDRSGSTVVDHDRPEDG